MPNFAAALKDEISRLVRKELKGDIGALRKTIATQRAEIAELKRRAKALEQSMRGAARSAREKESPLTTAPAASNTPLRFSSKGLATHRKRLGLSAAQVGLLVGTSGQSVYLWESGAVRPSEKHMPAIAALRSMGIREIAAKLGALQPK
jgi:DNA-binding transcriptional regulator YiaG